MYALSTIMFLTVLILLFLVNMTPDDPKVKKAAVHAPAGKFRKFSRFFFHRFAPAAIMLVIVIGGFVYGSSSGNMSGEKVIVYNWGDYIDPEIITMFEDETGIDVVYEEYETNEIMYPKVQSGAIAYDVVCPSDYMVQRMIENDLLAEINYKVFRPFPKDTERSICFPGHIVLTFPYKYHQYILNSVHFHN